jgi:hypothetical protein
MKSRMGAMLMIAALITLCLSIAGAQNKPDLSGVWKMNRSKSQFSNGGPETVTIKIDHKDPSYAESLTIGEGGEERTFETKYTTDGKEGSQEVMGRTAQTSAKWEGETLLINWKTEDRFFSRKVTLSADGKTMTVVVRQSGSDGQEKVDTVVFEKQ